MRKWSLSICRKKIGLKNGIGGGGGGDFSGNAGYTYSYLYIKILNPFDWGSFQANTSKIVSFEASLNPIVFYPYRTSKNPHCMTDTWRKNFGCSSSQVNPPNTRKMKPNYYLFLSETILVAHVRIHKSIPISLP